MIRTIKQRIYVIGILPLALLAVAAVIVNGVVRIQETSDTLRNAQRVTAALLHAPAVDALVVGNISGFEKAVQDVVKSSPWLACVTLRDATPAVVVQIGECSRVAEHASYSPVTVASDALSDFPRTGQLSEIGSLGIVVEDDGVQRDRRQVLIQLAASLILIGGVVWLVGRILKVRLIEPLQRIGWALGRLRARDYTARVPTFGNDEVTLLASAVNSTIQESEAYTRELEFRRKDADRALQDADEANLLRDGLIRSLTEDLERPINHMHSELTAIAIANQDPKLRDRIKGVIATLQNAQSDFADIIEVATSAQDPRRSAARHLTALLDDIRSEFKRISELDPRPIHFGVTAPGEPNEAFVGDAVLDIDGIRLRKVIVLLVRAMARYSLSNGIYVTLEVIRLSGGQLHLAIHIKAFYDPRENLAAASAAGEVLRDGPSSMKPPGLTERESKIVDYLLRAVGAAQTVSALPSGAAAVSLTMTCACIQEPSSSPAGPDWPPESRPVSATLISDDSSLLRLTLRGDISNNDVKLVTFARAHSNLPALGREDAVLLDMSGDIADGLRTLDLMRAKDAVPASLIAICPQGTISESLAEQLLDLGFRGVIQKPLYYSRLIQVIRATIDSANISRGRDAHG